ncbi:MAG: hypothetical protein ABFS19_05785 [Thermodesulfobacteriota bacterium]
MLSKLNHPAGILCICLLALFKPVISSAEQSTDQNEELVHWAYSAFQGSGIYSIDGEIIGMLNLPFSTSFTPDSSNGAELEIRYPLIVGFYDFDVREHGINDFDERLGTISFMPGLHYHLPQTADWTVTPFVDLGIGLPMGEGEHAWIYSAGVESRYTFYLSEWEFKLSNRLRYAGYILDDSHLADEYSTFETVIEYPVHTRAILFKRRLDITPHLFNQLFLDEVELQQPLDNHESLSVQWGAGLTIGLTSENEDALLPKIRCGIGFRYGNGLKGIHFLLGETF